MKVCLVNMPVCAIHRPSLGLSLIASLLKRAGIEVKVLYPNVWFAEYFNFAFYDELSSTLPDDGLIDWLFSASAFPDFEGSLDLLLDRAYVRASKLKVAEKEKLRSDLLFHRQNIPDFVDWVAREVMRQKPDIVGCTSIFQQHVASLALLRRVREIDDSVVTMLGGANCETIMGKTTHESFPWVDFVVSGEADGLIVDLCKSISKFGRDMDPVFVPFGVFAPMHRLTNYPSSAKSYDGMPRASAPNLEDIPPPDYDDYFEELRRSLYGHRIIPGILFETSRGCWWGERKQCTFCGLNGEGMGYRSKSPEKVIEEIRYLSNRYRTNQLEAVDNILELKYFNSLLPQLENMEDKYAIFFETKANLKRRQVEQLAKAGVRWIQPGIESLHSEVLKIMDKGISAWQNIQTLKYCRQFGVAVSWTIISYFPGERDEWYAEMAELIPKLQHLQAGGFISLRYDRFSPYHMDPHRFGVKLVPPPSYQEIYPLSQEKLLDLAYFFEEQDAGDYRPQVMMTPIPGRPGLQAARDAVVSWRKTWTNVRLVGRYEDDKLIVEDTRDCAIASTHVLQGLPRRVVEICDDALVRRKLYSEFTEPHDVLDEVVKDLLDKQLIVEVDGRLLSVILYEPFTLLRGIRGPLGRVLPAAKAAQAMPEMSQQA